MATTATGSRRRTHRPSPVARLHARPAMFVPADDAAPAEESAADTLFQDLDMGLTAQVARFTGGLSPIALAGAWSDWAMHLATSPGKQGQLVVKAGQKVQRLASVLSSCAFRPDAAYSALLYSQAFHTCEQGACCGQGHGQFNFRDHCAAGSSADWSG